MKDYKLIFAGLIVLALIIFLGVFSWLWFNNSKNIDPLPILSSEGAQLEQEKTEENQDILENVDGNTLYIQAQQPLQVPLDKVIISFESRYPHIQVLTNYVPAASLLTLDNSNPTDLVIADDQLSDSLLSLLQDELNRNVKNNIVNPPAPTKDNSDIGSNIGSNNDTETSAKNVTARILNPFGYAMKNTTVIEGVILSDKPVAINFRNYLVSSTGQDILRSYGFDNIDGYQNSVDDLFNPTSDGKTAVEKDKVVTQALSNGE